MWAWPSPSLLAAGSAALTPARFGTGSGILNTARQVGTVLGVAGLVAVLTHIATADPVAAYRHGLILIMAFFGAAGLTAAVLLTGRPARPDPPAATPGGRQPAGQDGLLIGRDGLPIDQAGRRTGQAGLRALGRDATARS